MLRGFSPKGKPPSCTTTPYLCPHSTGRRGKGTRWLGCLLAQRIRAPNPTSCSETVSPTASSAHTDSQDHPQTLTETAAHTVSSLSFNKQTTTTTKQWLFLKNLHLLREMLGTVITVFHSPVRFLVYPSFPLPWTMGRHTVTHLPRSAAWVWLCTPPATPSCVCI